LLPPGKDPRPYLEQVYACYAGKTRPEEVLSKADNSKDESARRDVAHAHFYVGLLYEVAGKDALARNEIADAAGRGRKGDLICDLARALAESSRKAASP